MGNDYTLPEEKIDLICHFMNEEGLSFPLSLKKAVNYSVEHYQVLSLRRNPKIQLAISRRKEKQSPTARALYKRG